jgi:two-component system chemotaxis response regulator CheB
MPRRDVVVIASSAGGIEALRDVLRGVPVDYDGVMLVVLHMPAGGGMALPKILDRAGPLPAAPAVDGEPLKVGRVYVCVADHHLLIGDGHVHVRRGPRENGHRPAADPLFRSAARYFGTRVVGVVLSGTLSDGTAGLSAVRRQGGVAIVQEPSDALYGGMPTSALDSVGADFVVPAAKIGPLLATLAREDGPADEPTPDETLRKEVALMEGDHDPVRNHPGRPSPWPCPDCNGVLWEIDDDVLRFRCRVGHAWSAESLIHEQGAAVEAALWVALRALEDRATLNRTLAERARAGGRSLSAGRFAEESEDIDQSIEILRRLVNTDEIAGALEEGIL